MKKTYETENYIIEYSENDKEFIEDILKKFANNSQRIMKFFKLKQLLNKVKIVIWDSIDAYKNNISPYLIKSGREYKEWMIADTMDGNINMLSISLVRTTKDRSDYNLTEFLDCVCHEFVHICHKQARALNNSKNSMNDSWFWELLATNLGNPNSRKIIPIEIYLNELQNDFDNIPENYNISYTIGQYLFAHFDEDHIYNLSIDNAKLEAETLHIFDKAKLWSKEQV